MPRNPTGPARPAKGERLDTVTVAKLLARARPAAIDTGALLSALIEQWGGTTRFAEAIFAEFQVGKAGGMSRQKIVEMVARLVVVTTNQAIARPRTPADMDDAEIEAELVELMGRCTGDGEATGRG